MTPAVTSHIRLFLQIQQASEALVFAFCLACVSQFRPVGRLFAETDVVSGSLVEVDDPPDEAAA
jgi:hypothetical protein